MTSEHPPSVSPTVQETVFGHPPRWSRGTGTAILVVLVVFLASAWIGLRRVANSSHSRAVLATQPAPAPNAPPIAQPAPPPQPSVACGSLDAAGAHQFIELEETHILGTVPRDDGP